MRIIQDVKNFLYPPIDTSLKGFPPELINAWKAAEFDRDILELHPDFADALFKGKLINPIQATAALQEEAGLYVEGKWVSWRDVQKRFSLDECDPETDLLKRQLIFRENETDKTFFYFKDAEQLGLQHLDERLLEKWTASEFDLEILLQFPRFAQMLRSTRILDEMQAIGAKPKLGNNGPTIVVDGKDMSWAEIQEQFEWPKLVMPKGEKDHYLRFNEMINKETHETYFYCGDKKGLQAHDAVAWKQMPTVAMLNDNEIARVQEVAQRFFQEERVNEGRNFVIQIVASLEKESSYAFNDTTSNPCHPYINIIATDELKVEGQTLYKGHVYQIGFWGARVPEGLTKLEGRFYSYDPHSLRGYDERLVTSIAISAKEVQQIFTQIHNWKNLKKPFHPTRQNCSAFVEAVCHEAGIAMDVEVTAFRLIGESFPPIIRKLGGVLYEWGCCAAGVVTPFVQKVIPETIRNWLCEKILLVWEMFCGLVHHLFMIPVRPVTMLAGDTLMGLDEAALMEERTKAPWFIPSKIYRYTHYMVKHPVGMRKFQLSHKYDAEKSPMGTTYISHKPTTIKETIVPPLKAEQVAQEV